jgi:hypothetical protein
LYDLFLPSGGGMVGCGSVDGCGATESSESNRVEVFKPVEAV